MEVEKLNINKKLIVNDLVSFIMTENCSFLCAHCMRGDRRPNTISEEVIDAVLSQIKINGTVHLGGDEPLLPIKQVVYLINQIYELGNIPRKINVITNASIGPKKFEEFISTLKDKNVTLDLTISNDYYHVQERLRLNNGEDNIITRLREYQKIMVDYGFKRPIDDYFWMLENYESFRNGDGVSAIGNGINIRGAEPRYRKFCLYKNTKLKKDNIKGRFQVQSDGRITSVVDMSWEERDNYYGQDCNILNNSLEMILKRR